MMASNSTRGRRSGQVKNFGSEEEDQAPRWKPLFLDLPRHPFPGRLVVFEGIDGSGKSTHLARLRHALSARGKRTIVTCAPTEDLRKHWAWAAWHRSQAARKRIDELGLTIMALGDRLINQSSTIVPALQAGAVVLSDRYVLSVLAYWSTPVHRFAIRRLFAPDLGIYCRIDPSRATERLARSRREPKFLRDRDFLDTLARRYDRLLPHYNYEQIDTELSIAKAAARIISLVDKVL